MYKIAMALESEKRDNFDDLPVIITSVGKIRCLNSLFKELDKDNLPEYIINLGTAGSSRIKRGSVVFVNKFVERDFDVSPTGCEKYVLRDGEEQVFEYGEVPAGEEAYTIGTGDNFCTYGEGDIWDLVDMEAIAIAKFCKENGIKLICAKYISDGADSDDSGVDWEAALVDGSKKLREFFDAKIKAMID